LGFFVTERFKSCRLPVKRKKRRGEEKKKRSRSCALRAIYLSAGGGILVASEKKEEKRRRKKEEKQKLRPSGDRLNRLRREKRGLLKLMASLLIFLSSYLPSSHLLSFQGERHLFFLIFQLTNLYV